MFSKCVIVSAFTIMYVCIHEYDSLVIFNEMKGYPGMRQLQQVCLLHVLPNES